MGRIKQLNPNNYQSSGNINAEFENLVRYLLTTERGTKTLGEMLAQIFDEDGDLSDIVDIRYNQASGIQYRSGTYTDPEAGWETVVSLDQIRGAPGVNVGSVALPVLTARADYTGTGAQTAFDYVYDSDDQVVVYKNGLLLRPGALFDYTLSANKVTFTAAPANGDDITVFKIRGDTSIISTRVDQTPVSTQTVFAYVVPDSAYELIVYKNGILQRAGGANDYVVSAATSTITFMSAVLTTDTVTFITIQSTTQLSVTGFMTEQQFVDPLTGQILWSRIGVADGAIAQGKVASLSDDLAARARLAIGGAAPAGPVTGQLWLDTSVAPNVLKFYDGVRWVSTSPESAIPPFNSTNAGQYLRINGTGTGIVIQDIDLSGLISSSQKGAANGVASLDPAGRVPEAQMPEVRATGNLFLNKSGAVTDGAYTVTRTYKQTIRIIALAAGLTSGSCQIQLKVAGTLVGPVYAISSTALDQPLSTLIEIDSLTASKVIAVAVSSASSAQDLSVTLAIEFLE